MNVQTAAAPSSPATSAAGPSVGYIVSRFPKITETFILREILALEEDGFAVELFPLVLVREERIHPEALRLKDAAHWTGLLAGSVWAAQAYWLVRKPGTYLKLWGEVLAGNLRSPKFLIRSLVALPRAAWMARRARKLGCRHLHAHFATHAALAAYAASRLAGIPYSFTAHAHDIYVERPMLDRKIRGSRFVVAISEFNRRYLRDLFGDEASARTRVIRCGVDTEQYVPTKPRGHGAGAAAEARMACIASLEEYKGHAYLVEACALLARQGIPFRCDLVGGGRLEGRLKAKVAAAGLADRIRFHGRLPQAEVRKILAASDLLVLPSIVTGAGKMEGLPVVLMEALALEIPVVSTDISGIPELVRDGETGVLVPQKDPAALADGISRQLGAPERAAAMARAGRELVLREFDLRKNVADLAALFRESMVGTAC